MEDVAEDFSYDPVRHDVIHEMAVAGGLKTLTPMIFVHGFGGNNVSNVGLCREFASHGHVVFSIDTHDGTCEYTEKENGTEVHFNPHIACSDEESVRDCLSQRVQDVTLLVDELHRDAFLQDVLEFPADTSLNLSRLSCNGLGSGGMTSIAAASADERIKVCLSLDPWFLGVYSANLDQYLVAVPIQSIRTELCDGQAGEQYFEQENRVKNEILDACSSGGNRKVEHIQLKGHAHLNQSDDAVLRPLERRVDGSIVTLPGSAEGVAHMYLLNAWLQLRFLDRVHMGSAGANTAAFERRLDEKRSHEQIVYERIIEEV